MVCTRRHLYIVVTILAIPCVSGQTNAGTPFFWDEFDREDLYDSTIAYYAGVPSGELSLVDDKLKIVPLADDYPRTGAVSDQKLSNFRIQTTFTFVDSPSGYNPFVFTSYWNSDTRGPGADWAGITSHGRFTAGVEDEGGNITWDQPEPILAPYRDMISHVVHMSTEVTASEQIVTVWLDGKEQQAKSYTERRLNSDVDTFQLGLNPTDELNETILFEYFALLPLIDGDYDASGALDVGDIDLMADQLRSPDVDRARVFDVNGDGDTNQADHTELITQLIGGVLGDANLDGGVAFDDFLSLSSNFGGAGGWGEGDFDASGKIDFADFLILSTNFEGSTEASAVPEPNGLVFSFPILLGLLRLRRRGQAALEGR